VSSRLGLFKRNPADYLGYANTQVVTAGSFVRRNMTRDGLTDSAGDSGQPAFNSATNLMTAVPIFLAGGDVVTNISAVSGATAANTPTNYWFALYSTAGTPALLAQTADQLTAAWAANTVKTLPLASAYTVPADGIYHVGIMVKATAAPSLLGTVAAPPIGPGERQLALNSGGTGLTGTAPATITSTTAQRFVPLVVIT
jgi:hypothetical protein